MTAKTIEQLVQTFGLPAAVVIIVLTLIILHLLKEKKSEGNNLGTLVSNEVKLQLSPFSIALEGVREKVVGLEKEVDVNKTLVHECQVALAELKATLTYFVNDKKDRNGD